MDEKGYNEANIVFGVDGDDRIISFREIEDAERMELSKKELYERFLKVYLATGYRFQ